ncbi:hypothetical protein C1646_774024 [Rhizophagus diaphanus]|nr:hypothetical protein C1646_774024 [Rhizophagus diaphanus] [Rhizophagus sp. MUCL 43196]
MKMQMNSNSVNKFQTSGYIAYAFPSLYSTGNTVLCAERIRDVKPAEYFKHLLLYKDRRFVCHARWCYFALNFQMLCAADLHWPELHKLMPSSDNSDTSAKHYHQNIVDNSHIAVWFFNKRFEIFLNDVLKQQSLDEEEVDLIIEDDEQEEYQLDWMLLAEMSPSSSFDYFSDLGSQDMDRNHDWINNPRSGGNKAKKANSDIVHGLEVDILLARGAQVMLTVNLQRYNNIWRKPRAALSVLISFDNYKRPTIASLKGERVVPIVPILMYFAWAIMVHKSQSLILNRAVIDLGNKKFTTKLSFIPVSRVHTLKDLLKRVDEEKYLVSIISKN